MAIKHGKINPLNVLGLRQVDFPAHHFTYTIVPKYNAFLKEKLNTWIRNNLSGRYYIGPDIVLTKDNIIIYATKVGFENEKELGFFNLACPDLN